MRTAVWGLGLILSLAAAIAAPQMNLDTIAGVYKTRHRMEVFMGEKEPPEEDQVEDVLEIVKLSPDTAYVRGHLQFDNGHICAFYQVMHVEGDALVWRGKTVLDEDCEMKLRPVGGKLAFFDKDDRCREGSCGARGVYNGMSFQLSSRRTIRYMPRLLASREYQEAVKGVKP